MKINFRLMDPLDSQHQHYKIKASYSRSHIITSTMNTTAASFINTRKMDNLKIYRRLLGVYQVTDHEEDKAINAVAIFEKPGFNRDSHHSPEKFLTKVNN